MCISSNQDGKPKITFENQHEKNTFKDVSNWCL